MTHTAVVIDDHVLMAHVLAQRVAEAGFVVVAVASTFDEGVHAVVSLQPCVVVVDVTLDGERSGFDLVAQLPSHLQGRCVLASASIHEGLADKVAACGAAGFIAKQVDTADFLHMLNVADPD